jgi:hypothetical protein
VPFVARLRGVAPRYSVVTRKVTALAYTHKHTYAHAANPETYTCSVTHYTHIHTYTVRRYAQRRIGYDTHVVQTARETYSVQASTLHQTVNRGNKQSIGYRRVLQHSLRVRVRVTASSALTSAPASNNGSTISALTCITARCKAVHRNLSLPLV